MLLLTFSEFVSNSAIVNGGAIFGENVHKTIISNCNMTQNFISKTDLDGSPGMCLFRKTKQNPNP